MLYDKFRAKEGADLVAPRQASPMEMGDGLGDYVLNLSIPMEFLPVHYPNE